MTEQQERAAVVAAAHDWLGTPFRNGARIKRVGVDCGHFIAAAFEDAGLQRRVTLPRYPANWFMFQSKEIFLDTIADHTVEIDASDMREADIVVYRFGRCYSHGAIITQWPLMIHAFAQAGKVIINHGDQGFFATRRRRFFRHKIWSH